MFYGQGAGAGATASAVVGDLMQIMRSGRNTAQPTMIKSSKRVLAFESFECRHYLSVDKSEKANAKKLFGNIEIIAEGEETGFITEKISEAKLTERLKNLNVKSHIRLL
jgi:hypothetical protein